MRSVTHDGRWFSYHSKCCKKTVFWSGYCYCTIDMRLCIKQKWKITSDGRLLCILDTARSLRNQDLLQCLHAWADVAPGIGIGGKSFSFHWSWFLENNKKPKHEKHSGRTLKFQKAKINQLSFLSYWVNKKRLKELKCFWGRIWTASCHFGKQIGAADEKIIALNNAAVISLFGFRTTLSLDCCK